MAEGAPDELYTLRAQYWLGHFASAVQEAKSVARRPMSPELKEEREEYLYKAYAAMRAYDKCTASPGDPAGLQAISLKAQFEAAVGNPAKRKGIADALKSLAATGGPTTQLAAAQVCLALNEPAAAYAHVATGSSTTLELAACKLQILLKLDRLDLAQKELAKIQAKYEESVLAELCSVYVCLSQGAAQAEAAEHTLNALSEQYGPSVFLLNLLAAAHAVAGDYAAAETKLTQCLRDFGEVTVQHETHVNLVCVQQQQHKPTGSSLDELLKTSTPSATSMGFAEGLNMVTTAFDREAIKYKV